MRSRHTSPVFASAATLAVAAMAAACIGSATPVHAATIASDNAANYEGSGGSTNVWTNISNTATFPTEPSAGTGFGAWAVSV